MPVTSVGVSFSATASMLGRVLVLLEPFDSVIGRPADNRSGNVSIEAKTLHAYCTR